MKKLILTLTGIGLFLILAFILLLKGCVIQNTQPSDCAVIDIKITRITEDSSYDIMFHNENRGFYYINRGLEQGLNLDSLKTKVLNKTVTLHLAKNIGGVTNHISQMALGSDIIFTEFSSIN